MGTLLQADIMLQYSKCPQREAFYSDVQIFFTFDTSLPQRILEILMLCSVEKQNKRVLTLMVMFVVVVNV